MKLWRVDYYKTRNWVDCKLTKAETAEEAIKKQRLKIL
jgi:hypothetical protein